MTQPDLLEQAAQALRAAHTGQRDGAASTRARIMVTLHRERRRRLLRWALWSPLCTLALAGSAWAQSTGSWPKVWQAVANVLSLEVSGPERGPEEAPQPPPRAALPAEAAPLAEVAPPAETLPPTEPVRRPEAAPVQGLPADVAAPLPSSAPPRRTVTQHPAAPAPPTAAPAPSDNEPASPPPHEENAADPELRSFRTAHDLHVARRESAAIAAYQAYLAAFPEGRFVPEARYNIALNQVRLGDKAAARATLAPFADGAYGHYRREEARRLLEALR